MPEQLIDRRGNLIDEDNPLAIKETNPPESIQVSQDPIYDFVANGELIGSITAIQCPDVPCEGIILMASYDNAGRVYVGGPGVTVAAGTTTTTAGLQLVAEKGIFLPISNLNLLWRICDNAGDDLTYIVVR